MFVQKILGPKIVLISLKFDPSKISAPKKEVQKAWLIWVSNRRDIADRDQCNQENVSGQMTDK